MALANRSEVASDTFDTTIDGSWTNPTLGLGSLAWQTGGFVRPGGSGDRGMRRNTGTYSDDQYCTVTMNSLANANGNWVAAGCQDDATNVFWFFVETAESDEYRFYDEAFNDYGSGAWAGAPLVNGDTVTLEHLVNSAESDLEGFTDEGSGDTSRLGPTTTTGSQGQTGGRPDIFLRHNAAGNSEITAWSGGDWVAAGGTTPKGPLGHPLHGPLAGPVGP